MYHIRLTKNSDLAIFYVTERSVTCLYSTGVTYGMTEDKNRKDQILDAAFALIQLNDRWSLSEVAARVGVSKTALYRHYRNKAELEDAMQADLACAITRIAEDLLRDNSPGQARRARTAFRALMSENPGYLSLFLTCLFAGNGYEMELLQRVAAGSQAVAAWLAKEQARPDAARAVVSRHFLKSAATVLAASFPLPGTEKLQLAILDFCSSGFPALAEPEAQRLDELDSLCRVEIPEQEQNSRLLKAIAAAIHAHGVRGATIERIAEAMGTAKSSLYFYYKTKEEMLADLLETENRTVMGFCLDCAGHGRTLAEQLYIIMSLQARYLEKRPELVSVFNWMRYEAFQNMPDPHSREDLIRFMKPWHLKELFPSGTDQLLQGVAVLKWASLLATSTIIQGNRPQPEPHISVHSIRDMFYSMLRGDKELP